MNKLVTLAQHVIETRNYCACFSIVDGKAQAVSLDTVLDYGADIGRHTGAEYFERALNLFWHTADDGKRYIVAIVADFDATSPDYWRSFPSEIVAREWLEIAAPHSEIDGVGTLLLYPQTFHMLAHAICNI